MPHDHVPLNFEAHFISDSPTWAWRPSRSKSRWLSTPRPGCRCHRGPASLDPARSPRGMGGTSAGAQWCNDHQAEDAASVTLAASGGAEVSAYATAFAPPTAGSRQEVSRAETGAVADSACRLVMAGGDEPHPTALRSGTHEQEPSWRAGLPRRSGSPCGSSLNRECVRGRSRSCSCAATSSSSSRPSPCRIQRPHEREVQLLRWHGTHDAGLGETRRKRVTGNRSVSSGCSGPVGKLSAKDVC